MFNIIHFFTADQTEINAYFRNRRAARYGRFGAEVRGIGFHSLMHHLMLPGLVLERKLKNRRLTILADRRSPGPARPTVYACAHIGGCDVESAFEAIHDPCFLFMGDPGPVYRSFDGLVLALNGLICLETRDKLDRHIAKERGAALLAKGGSLLIYPEGAWNVTENEPVMKLFPGAASFALDSGADIVPLALERYGDHYYAIIGPEIHTAGLTGTDAKALTAQLRDILATLKWEIWAHQGLHSRAALPPDYAETQFYPMFAPVQGYGLQDALETRYHDKHQTTPEEAFSHLDSLIPNHQNAFLFRNR